VYCGDHRRGKELAAELIRDVGFDPVGSYDGGRMLFLGLLARLRMTAIGPVADIQILQKHAVRASRSVQPFRAASTSVSR
jgi:hypothetical protein